MPDKKKSQVLGVYREVKVLQVKSESQEIKALAFLCLIIITQ